MSLSLPSILAAGKHHYDVTVYYEDSDAGGIVYHANYLRFAERARTELLRALGVPHAELVEKFGLMFVVRRIKLDYWRPARVDDRLTVVSRPVALGAASMQLSQTVLRADERLVGGEIGLACVRVASGRPARMPRRWQEACAALMQGAAGEE
jgi:acyl-CoA thioester hydrolase